MVLPWPTRPGERITIMHNHKKNEFPLQNFPDVVLTKNHGAIRICISTKATDIHNIVFFVLTHLKKERTLIH